MSCPFPNDGIHISMRSRWRSIPVSPGLLGYALFFVFLGRRLFDSRPEVALSSLVVILALFPLNSSVSFYSYFNGNILFLTLALLIALDRDIKPQPELDPVNDAQRG